MEYVLTFLALLATLFGLGGKTFENGRPTIYGWLVGISAILVCCFTLYQHYLKNIEMKKRESVACTQLLRGIHGVVSPFAHMLADVDLRKHQNQSGITETNTAMKNFVSVKQENLKDINPNFFMKLLPLSDYMNILDGYKINDYTIVLNGERGPTWMALFANTALHGIKEMDDVLSAFSGSMDANIIAALKQFRNAWLTKRIEKLSEPLKYNINPSVSLGRYLKFDETMPGESRTILEEFVKRAKNAHGLCAERLKT